MIPTKLLSIAAHILCFPLSHIFNRSIETKTFPTIFKYAYVCPVPKKQAPSIHDLRPISLLPVVSKVFERLVLRSVKPDLLRCYSVDQHAYRPCGSTTSALVCLMDRITSAMDKNDATAIRIICLDLSRAFDGLKFNRLLNHLNRLGLNHGFLLWLMSYLSCRRFSVKISDNVGESVCITSGVPQGSVLGPYLFAAFMSCISFNVVNTISSVQYADDVTLIETIRDSKQSTISINDISQIFHNAGLKLNKNKCKEMIVYRSPDFSLPADGNLERVDRLRILGLTLTNKLSWFPHLFSIVRRASRSLYVIRCLRNVLPRKELITIYHALITSIFLYASPVFGNAPSSFFVKLDNFQRRGHKLICGSSCKCDNFPRMSVMFLEASLKFLSSCRLNKHHPLHHLVPPRLPRTGHYRLPSCVTSRRLNSFFPFYCMKSNELNGGNL